MIERVLRNVLAYGPVPLRIGRHGVDHHPDSEFHVLVPNEKGYEASQAAGARVIAVFASASEGFSRANINCSVAESIARFTPKGIETEDGEVHEVDAVITATGFEVMKYLWPADYLGVDDVIATRYEVDDDDVYTGGLSGPFVWSAGKLAAVQAWADLLGGVDI